MGLYRTYEELKHEGIKSLPLLRPQFVSYL